MGKAALARLLTDWCERQEELPALVEAVRAKNPTKVRRYERRIASESGIEVDALGRRLDELLAPDDVEGIVTEARLIRELVRNLRRTLDTDAGWEAAGPVAGMTGADIEAVRTQLVSEVFDVLAAVDYLVALTQRRHEREGLRALDLEADWDDRRLRYVYEARTVLAKQTRRLWKSLSDVLGST